MPAPWLSREARPVRLFQTLTPEWQGQYPLTDLRSLAFVYTNRTDGLRPEEVVTWW